MPSVILTTYDLYLMYISIFLRHHIRTYNIVAAGSETYVFISLWEGDVGDLLMCLLEAQLAELDLRLLNAGENRLILLRL